MFSLSVINQPHADAIDLSVINKLHADAIDLWKSDRVLPLQTDLYQLVLSNHAFNYQLWHAEDRARRTDMGYQYVHDAKREIDHCNQQRNNFMEKMDSWIFENLKPASHLDCPVHSETPGMMLDRLSILALKAWHMARQTEREDVEEAHRENCRNKLAIIQEQQQQLSNCLDKFLEEIAEGKRTFRVYYQMKMYNDPTLNPQLYRR